MSSVLGGFMVLGRGVGMDVIDILVFLACYLHQAVHHFDPGRLGKVCLLVEVTPFPVDGMLENQRFSGVGSLDFLDEGEESLTDLFRCRIGECVENECIHICCCEDIGEIVLELAVAAAA